MKFKIKSEYIPFTILGVEVLLALLVAGFFLLR